MGLYLWLTIIAGIILGLYEISKKKALENKSLLAVLMMYATFNFLFVIFEYKNAITIQNDYLIMLAFKSVIVFGSWILSFMAIKNLPISVITPFGTLSPIFSILLGMLILNEKLGDFQIIGLIIIFISYYFVSNAAKVEIGNLLKNKYLYLMTCAMILSAISGLIDKISLKSISVEQAQFWFNGFTAVLFILTYILFSNKEKLVKNFSFYIPLMSILLVCSDRIYFIAMKIPESQLSIVSPLRRISIIVSVILGGIIFKEKNILQKAFAVLLLIVGIMILFIGTK